MCEKYNGWTNWATWNTHLWLSNDPGLYDEARTEARHGIDQLRDWVEDFIFDELPPEPAGIGPDLLTWAFGKVNWGEVVEALTEGDEEE